jgi:biopolymer transport protein ExbD
MRKRRRRLASDVEINVVPLIDCLFFLLIFLAVTTHFTDKTKLALTLPDATGQPSVETPKKIEIAISRQGDYVINGHPLVNRQIETLKSALAQISAGNYQQPLVITSDANAPYQAVVTAMDACGQLGFVNLSLTTKRPQKS